MGDFLKINCNGTDATLINEMEKVKSYKVREETKGQPSRNAEFKQLFDWKIDSFKFVHDDHYNCTLCCVGRKRTQYKQGHGRGELGQRKAVKRGRPSK